MWPKVFISSTYSDLKPFRKAVWEELNYLNIKILGMEEFGARTCPPLDTCMEELSKASIFICIIAFRYGSVDKDTKKSYTQLEYEKAFSQGKEILIYCMDESALVTANNVDRGQNASRLDKFKNDLKAKHTIDSFKEPEQLAEKVHKRLNTLIPTLNSTRERPKVLECTVTRFNVGDKPWIAFVGYLMGRPYEIFTGWVDMDLFPVPSPIINGKIIKNKNEEGKTRYDFQYLDKYGYKNTLGGLNHVFDKHASKYGIMISKLLRNNIDPKVLESIIDEMEIFENYSSEDWKKGVKKALKLDKS